MKQPEVKFDGITIAVYFAKDQFSQELKIENGFTPTGRPKYKTVHHVEYHNQSPEAFLSFIQSKGLIPAMLQKEVVMKIAGKEIESKEYPIEMVKQNLSPIDNPEYEVMFNIRSSLGYLVTILCSPRKRLNSYYLVKFHGLLFSDLSYNPMRDYQDQLLASIRQFVSNNENLASVSKIDIALDFFSSIPYFNLRQQMHTSPRDYCTGYVVKESKKHRNIQPFLGYLTSIYWGVNGKKSSGGRSTVCLYKKNLCPRQDIYSEDNPPKFVWYRLELRLKKTAAKNHGMKLLLSNNLASDVAELFPKFLDFHDYKQPKQRQVWFQNLLDNLL